MDFLKSPGQGDELLILDLRLENAPDDADVEKFLDLFTNSDLGPYIAKSTDFPKGIHTTYGEFLATKARVILSAGSGELNGRKIPSGYEKFVWNTSFTNAWFYSWHQPELVDEAKASLAASASVTDKFAVTSFSVSPRDNIEYGLMTVFYIGSQLNVQKALWNSSPNRAVGWFRTWASDKARRNALNWVSLDMADNLGIIPLIVDNNNPGGVGGPLKCNGIYGLRDWGVDQGHRCWFGNDWAGCSACRDANGADWCVDSTKVRHWVSGANEQKVWEDCRTYCEQQGSYVSSEGFCFDGDAAPGTGARCICKKNKRSLYWSYDSHWSFD